MLLGAGMLFQHASDIEAEATMLSGTGWWQPWSSWEECGLFAKERSRELNITEYEKCIPDLSKLALIVPVVAVSFASPLAGHAASNLAAMAPQLPRHPLDWLEHKR